MSVVLDTNTLISAIVWDGSISEKMLTEFIKNKTKIYISLQILAEFQKILKREFKYDDEQILNITGQVLAFSILIEPTIKLNVVEDDPDDNMFIECALTAKAKYIITMDEHLLKIEEYENIKIITPRIARAMFWVFPPQTLYINLTFNMVWEEKFYFQLQL